MERIARGQGTTQDERYLLRLAERSFLNLWSYPNIYFDKKQNGTGDGKEVCDLLVVCGDDVVIFSDKGAKWSSSCEFHLAWSRWYRAAIEEALIQLKGANRVLTLFEDKVFLDPACSQRLPIALPPANRRRLHKVITASGANDASARFFGTLHGAFRIMPELKGKDHVDRRADGYKPFSIGDVDPDNTFCHVFDRSSFDVLMTEFDTISDFTKYLEFRSQLIRSGKLTYVATEHDLCALYIESVHGISMRPVADEHGNYIPLMEDLAIRSTAYEDLINSAHYKTKKLADRASYAWDQLINVFSTNVLAGTSVSISDDEASFATSERVLRIMAAETRLKRRSLGESWLNFLDTNERHPIDKRARVITSPIGTGNGVAYIFLALDYPKFALEGGYKRYREFRLAMLKTYAVAILRDRSDLKFSVAIGFDAGHNPGSKIRSEEIVGMEPPDWSPEILEWLAKSRAHFNVLNGKRTEAAVINNVFEMPYFVDTTPLSRQQRRAAERAASKKNR